MPRKQPQEPYALSADDAAKAGIHTAPIEDEVALIDLNLMNKPAPAGSNLTPQEKEDRLKNFLATSQYQRHVEKVQEEAKKKEEDLKEYFEEIANTEAFKPPVRSPGLSEDEKALRLVQFVKSGNYKKYVTNLRSETEEQERRRQLQHEESMVKLEMERKGKELELEAVRRNEAQLAELELKQLREISELEAKYRDEESSHGLKISPGQMLAAADEEDLEAERDILNAVRQAEEKLKAVRIKRKQDDDHLKALEKMLDEL